MSKIFIITLLIPSFVFAKGIQVKPDSEIQIPVGYVCYSPEELNKIDVKQKTLIDCQANLSKAESRPAAPVLPVKTNAQKLYEKRWFQVTLGAVILGFGIGIGKTI